jgi:hypothetical protein
MQKIILILSVFVSIIFGETVFFEPNVKIDSRIDLIVQTLSSRSGVAVPSGFSQQPFDYYQIRNFLLEVEKCQNLTQTDKEFLKILQDKFSGDSRIFGFEDGAVKRILVNLDLSGDIRANIKDSASLDAKGVISPRISANLGAVSFYSEMDVWTQYRSDTAWYGEDYQPFHGQTYNLIGDRPSHFRAADGFRGGISTQFKSARIDVAVDNLTSGPAMHNRLIMNAVDKPIFYTRVALDFKKMQYYQVFGLLREINLYNKYLYYHRLQFPFFDGRFVFGINESIVSGSTADDQTMAKPHPSQHLAPWHLNRDRKIEPVYMVPLLPYVFAEHYGGDLDNKQIALDFELKLPQIARWYMEFLIDDCQSPLEMFNDQWGNKWAVTLGTQWFPVIAGKNAVFGLEYCRVEPWVYTHFYGVANNYEHYGKGIGAELGPNSAQIRGLAQYYFSQKHGLQFEIIHNRFNRSVRGGNIGDVFRYYYLDSEKEHLPADTEKKEFLGKDYQKSHEISLSYLFRQFKRFEMKASAIYNSEKGAGMEFSGGFRF